MLFSTEEHQIVSSQLAQSAIRPFLTCFLIGSIRAITSGFQENGTSSQRP